MEVSASGQVDYNVHMSIAPELLAIQIQEEKNALARIPAEEAEPQTNDFSNSDNEESVPLSSSADIRSFLYAANEQEQGESEQSSDSENRSGEPVENADLFSTEQADEPGVNELTPEEEEQVQELKTGDQEVRQHEQAHLAAAGSYASGGPQFEYQTGPDGKQYAIGGHVNIDTSKENSPEATIAKAKQVQRAALAPADPSPQDVKIAAQANQMLIEAQRELSGENSEQEESSNFAETSEVQQTVGRLEENGVIL